MFEKKIIRLASCAFGVLFFSFGLLYAQQKSEKTESGNNSGNPIIKHIFTADQTALVYRRLVCIEKLQYNVDGYHSKNYSNISGRS